MRSVTKLLLAGLVATTATTSLFFACSSASDSPTATADAGPDSGGDAGHDGDPESKHPPFAAGPLCSLPGSIQYSAGKMGIEPGGPAGDVGYVVLPDGFCVHYYGNVGDARQVRMAPGGEIFVASPTAGTTGGNSGAGQAAIVVLPDDDHDGTADKTTTFIAGLPSTQGMMFAKDHFYYQDNTKIMRIPYKTGDRVPSAPGELVTDVSLYSSSLHWPKPLDISDDGTIYVGNGGDQDEKCDETRPFHGGVLKLDGADGGTPVTKGFRNPIAVRCQHGHNQCYSLELALDYSGNNNTGGREKLVPIRQDDDWGFPCCATKDIPYPLVSPVPDCSAIAQDTDSFLIGDTPFGLDFEPGKWPAPYKNSAFVATHGSAGTWLGARLVMIATDPTTGAPLPGTNIVFDAGDTGAMTDFATGWNDDGAQAHGRPAAVTFTPDGRLFITNDSNGDILWIAPLSL